MLGLGSPTPTERPEKTIAGRCGVSRGPRFPVLFSSEDSLTRQTRLTRPTKSGLSQETSVEMPILKCRPMLGFKSFHAAQKTLVGIELMNMIKKGQMRATRGARLTPAEQFYSLAA